MTLSMWMPGMMLEGREHWAPCPGYELEYLISTWGRVMRVAPGPGTRIGRLVSIQTSGSGYRVVQLSHRGRRKTHNLHRLVARTFRGEPPKHDGIDLEAHHGPDPDLANNCAWNVQYVTKAENLREQAERRRREKASA